MTHGILRISFYSTASTEESVFVIGGYTGNGFISVIAEFKDGSWTNAGRLRKVSKMILICRPIRATNQSFPKV